jgi:putative ATP-dependent endonuclease of OLD family
MRLRSVRIQNSRAFRDETIELNPYTCLVGPNGAGKSTILCALNVFFREIRDAKTNLLQLQEEDFHLKDTSCPIKITVTFCDLSPEAQTDFKHYYRNGELVVSAIAAFSAQSCSAEVVQHGSRMVMREFSPYFELLNATALVSALKSAYVAIRSDFPELPAPGTKDAMTAALSQYEEAHPERCTLVESPSEFYGFSRGTGLLEKYIEWICVPAVKDASTEQMEAKNNAFGRLVSRAVHAKVQLGEALSEIREAVNERYGQLLDENTSALNELSASLQARVARWAHPDARVELMWDRDPERSVSIKDPSLRVRAGEGGFLGELSRFGHGLQRSYLLALLQVLFESESVGPKMILACEEPELYQHPPQARYLASVLVDLSAHDSQVIVSTHSPNFVGGEVFEDVRVVRKAAGSSHAIVKQAKYDRVATRIAEASGKMRQRRQSMAAILHRSLQRDISEMFFGHRFVLVEGVEDAAYISAYIHLSGRTEAFRRGGHMLIPAHGKSNMLEPLAVALEMEMSFLVVFDADGAETRQQAREQHRIDNTCILRALGARDPPAFPAEPLWLDHCVVWPNKLSDLVESDIGPELWSSSRQQSDERWGHAGNLAKNPLHIGSTLHVAWEAGGRSATLENLCQRILV